jgi:hypothetical protein
MEENLLLPQPGFKLYQDRAIYVGTFLGGPLVAGYLAAENFKRLGQQDKVRQTWFIAIGATIVIFGGIFLIPGIEKIPNIIIPLIYTAIAQMLIRRYQGAAIKAHIEAGGQTFSIWRAVWIGLVGVLILVAILLVILLLTDKELLMEILSELGLGS